MDEGIEMPPPTSSPRSVGSGTSPRRALAAGASGLLTDDQIDLVLADLADDEREKGLGSTVWGRQTWSRYLVTNYFMNYKWYNPNKDNPNAPSLSKGWTYFEHFTLPRRFEGEGKIGGHQTRAPPGKTQGTKLYGAFSTPQESLSDWGIGMGMYFSTLQATFFIFLIAGLINVANIVYYSSAKYDPGTDGLKKFDLIVMLQFSMVCTDREWVVCSEPKGVEDTCRDHGEGDHRDIWNNIFTKSYFGTAFDENGDEVTLINQTTCEPANFPQGIVNYVTLLFLIVSMSLFFWFLSKKEVRFDEDNTTAADYSVIVHNPPPDAVDPDEWRDYFDVYSDKGVTAVTVALDNEVLLKKLLKRRMDVNALKGRLPMGSHKDFDIDDENAMKKAVENAKRYRLVEEDRRNCIAKLFSGIFTPLLRKLGLSMTETMIWERIQITTKEIRELQKKEYNAAAVYVTFETEQGQRTALEALSASEMEIMTNRVITSLDSSVLFRNERILRVEEAPEPNAVRWTDLHYSYLGVYIRQAISLAVTFGLVALSALILQASRLRVNTILYAVILSGLNTSIPIVVKILLSFEKHYDEGSKEKSLYVMITFFRWMNTAVVLRWITPILASIGQQKIDLINTVNSLMISEMVVSPMIRYVDPGSFLKRHILAPRAKSEEAMLRCFDGGYYSLAERFTDFTKVLLLCIFYSAFYPLVYFLGAATLFLQYWMDKFLLLRSWQKAPYFDAEISRFSRSYFNSLAILLGAISSAYAYVRAPYTMLCSCQKNGIDGCFTQEAVFNNVQLNNDESIEELTVNANGGYFFCNQDVDWGDFPPLPKLQRNQNWMTDSQVRLTSIYGWTCLILLILYLVMAFGTLVMKAGISLIRGVYEPRGVDQQKDFSSGIGLESVGYIPQLHNVPGFSFPLLICDIDDVQDVRLIGWNDPNNVTENEHRSYDMHNLIFDVPHETISRSRHASTSDSTRENAGRPIYSIYKHYPPAWARRAEEESEQE